MAGFTAVEIADTNGNVAASFSQAFALTVTVPAGTINPETGNAVQAGDVIPFWSYNETTGQWQSEGTVTLGAESNGVLTGVASINHIRCTMSPLASVTRTPSVRSTPATSPSSPKNSRSASGEAARWSRGRRLRAVGNACTRSLAV